MNQPQISQGQQNPLQLLYERANQAYQAGNYRQALKELQQALDYAQTEKDLEVIEKNMRLISEIMQKEEMQKKSEESAEISLEAEESEPAFYQNRLLLITVLVGIVCFTPIIMKLIEILTTKPIVQEQVTSSSGTPDQGKTLENQVVQESPTLLSSVVQGFITGNKVALREQPNISSRVLIRLNQNEKVEILEDKSQNSDGHIWSKIKTQAGQIGWVSASFLSSVENTSIAQEPESPPSASNENSNENKTSVFKKINATNVNLRSGPSVKEALIMSLPAETEVEVLQDQAVTADGLSWSQIKTKQGNIGWIASKYIQP